MIIVKVPGVNGLGKTRGTQNAGNKILEYFQTKSLEEIQVNNNNLKEQEELIRKSAKRLFEKQDRIVFLGGDHSISYPLANEFFNKFKTRARLVVFDAHADCMLPMKEPTHEEWLRALIESGFPAKNILLIGARKIEPEEQKFLEKNKLKRISVEDINKHLDEELTKIKIFVSEGKIYVSFDIDVFDSSLVKATGYPEKNGLNEKEVIEILESILKADVIAADLVEVNLEKKGLEETARLAKKVLKRFIS